EQRLAGLTRERDSWITRAKSSAERVATLETETERAAAALVRARAKPEELAAQKASLLDTLAAAETRRAAAADAMSAAEGAAQEADRAGRAAPAARERRAGLSAHAEAAAQRLDEADRTLRETAQMSPEDLGKRLTDDAVARPPDAAGAESLLFGLEREREALGAVNLRA